MDARRVIFERGIELSSSKNSVKLPSGMSANDVTSRYGVRPIMVTSDPGWTGPPKPQVECLYTLDAATYVDCRVSAINRAEEIHEDSHIFKMALNVQYVTGTTVYHCKKLALTYVDLLDTKSRIDDLQSERSDASTFAGHMDGFYEFDALMMSARRTYDSLRYLLWHIWGEKHSSPRNFETTIRTCNRLPHQLKDRLDRSWVDWGNTITAYRDFAIHNAPIFLGLHTAFLERIEGGTWSMRMLIPDNPECKSQEKATFNNSIDALEFGWRATNEITEVSQLVIKEVDSFLAASLRDGPF